MVRKRIAAQTGLGIELARGAELTVIDPEGEQVADLFAFARGDTSEWLSSGRSIDYNGTVRLTRGPKLYSNRSNALFTIIADDVGVHDFLFTPCSQEMFRIQYGVQEAHPNCLDNLTAALAPYGVQTFMISTPFNIFMNTSVRPDGSVAIEAPSSRAGDKLVLRAEMDLIVAVSACSAGTCNNHSCKPIDVEYPSG